MPNTLKPLIFLNDLCRKIWTAFEVVSACYSEVLDNDYQEKMDNFTEILHLSACSYVTHEYNYKLFTCTIVSL